MNKKREFLVTGGAGYIGSHMVRYLKDKGEIPVILDNFSTGHRWATQECEVIEVDITDKYKMSSLLNKRRFECIFHFAAKSLVSESIEKRDLYFETNLQGTKNLVQSLDKGEKRNKIIYSSSAAIYGKAKKSKIKEEDPKKPINPYGLSKLKAEEYLKRANEQGNVDIVSLRYFNAAGAHSSAEIGEHHINETHLIPNLINSLFEGESSFEIYGIDYDTKDGTCIRDYIHVEDLAEAHFLAYMKIRKKRGAFEYNLGSGRGFSVLEIISECENVSGKKINYKISNRREGDPSILIADNSLALKDLNWQTKYSSLDNIIRSAYEWHKNKNRNL